jgi:hypothetical protein
MDLASPTLRSAQDGLGIIDNQECPGWTWHCRHSGMPRMDLATWTSGNAQDGLKEWTPRMDSQDGLPGWTSRMDLASWTVNNVRIQPPWTYPRSDTKDQPILGYQILAICLYPRSVCRKQIHDFHLLGMWEYYLRPTTVGSWNPRVHLPNYSRSLVNRLLALSEVQPSVLLGMIMQPKVQSDSYLSGPRVRDPQPD